MTNRGTTITLLDDEGRSHAFTLVDVVEVDDRRYAVLQPQGEEGSAVLFRVEGELLTPVDEDEEFDRVVAELQETGDYDALTVVDEDDRRRRGVN
ncbi:MAG: DUF1292 domain-containing protein [Armatimonadota bacterium]|nr:DUF1292 domain-containing protein [Armatimonadota bacterium]MDR7450434.1 DUF1292 domain-containing protein [Armatimonadota bacterium]MDR7466983.1 DUF1292 domain-containing protein [Armatimonadota bacterium]MDR7493475.1 DUF1292 domain-containing protein [Armatimonadota bacterium]MDR7498740.1 DUF1292 domain-containing protein [Armatimonadota bacterium]